MIILVLILRTVIHNEEKDFKQVIKRYSGSATVSWYTVPQSFG